MPKVSAIVAIYKVEKYIERCAVSLFEQTLDDIQYIFVDDCTPDKSMDILQQVMELYPNRKGRVTICHHEHNQGIAAARKTGLNEAQGQYVIFCDSDDWVDKEMYRLMYEKAIEENDDIVSCGWISAKSSSSFGGGGA